MGLALPETLEHPRLGLAPHRIAYPNLTKYFVMEVGDTVPDELDDWASAAFARVTELTAQKAESK